MKFLVVEKFRANALAAAESQSMDRTLDDMKYRLRLQKEKKIIEGGPFLDTLGVCYILETKTIEEMGEIFFDSPSNFYVDREVHPLGSFQDTLEGLTEMSKPKKRTKQ